eukprot:gene3157-3626_t
MPLIEGIRPSQNPGLVRDTGTNNFLTAEEQVRRQRLLGRIPALSGKHDFASFNDKKNSQFIKVESDERFVQTHPEFNPVADTTSSFPSVGAEAKSGDFKPHSILINKEEDPRPGSVEPDKMVSGEEAINQVRQAPWEKRKDELLQYYKPARTPVNDCAGDEDDKIAKNTLDILNNRELRDKIATRAFYTSTTQKLYEGVDWANVIQKRQDPPKTVKETRPDMVTQRVRRFEDRPEEWQKLSGKPLTWDYLQSRDGHYIKKPVSFGQVLGEGEKDVHGEPYTALTQLRLSKPRYTITSRRGYIPGYTGCVLWTNHQPPLSAEREPRPESTARAHRRLTYPPNYSTYKHEGPLSKMVTLTHPFNPFNKKQPSPSSTASGNRV